MIDPDIVHRRVEALCAKKTLGEWLEEAIDEKVAERKDKRKAKVKCGVPLSPLGFLRPILIRLAGRR